MSGEGREAMGEQEEGAAQVPQVEDALGVAGDGPESSTSSPPSSSPSTTCEERRLGALELEEEEEEEDDDDGVVKCGGLATCCLPWNKRSSQQYSLAKADALRGGTGEAADVGRGGGGRTAGCVCLRLSVSNDDDVVDSGGGGGHRRHQRQQRQQRRHHLRRPGPRRAAAPSQFSQALPPSSLGLSSSSSPPFPSSPSASASETSASFRSGQTAVFTQVDYVNYFIPRMTEIVSCPFYWGKIDRYEAEALLENKPEGSFLLRDSAQDEFVFSVSFRRYNRSLHARIEERQHQFSFDVHDPGVHSSRSIRGLLEHYQEPMSCMFFEPMLLHPVKRNRTFDLQSLARAAVCDATTYAGVSQLPLPRVLKAFLREYSYRHKIRSRQVDNSDGGAGVGVGVGDSQDLVTTEEEEEEEGSAAAGGEQGLQQQQQQQV